MWIEHLKKHPLVAVLRATSENEALEMAQAIYAGGIYFLEITFTVPNADRVIASLIRNARLPKAHIGAGTVITIEQAHKAVDAGASYLVGPYFNPEIALYCRSVNIPYLPGCMTITEMVNAINYDVEVIKLFPGQIFGPQYIKSIKGPLPQIQIMPTGGVDLNNLGDWFKAGAIACGIGSDLTLPFKNGGAQAVTLKAKQYVDAYQLYFKENTNG